MIFAYLLVSAMAVFAASAAVAFAWAVARGQFQDLGAAASSIFWDEEPAQEVDDGH